MTRKRKNNTLYFTFDKSDWEGNWARRVMTITKGIDGWRYNHGTKEWSIPLSKEKEWRETIDAESVEYWSQEDYDEWSEMIFGE